MPVMCYAKLRHAAVCTLLLCCALVQGCNKQQAPDQGGENPFSDASYDPGTHPLPTNEQSTAIFGDPKQRREYFAYQMNEAHLTCGDMYQAVLKGGFNGSDVWRVRCSSTGYWAATIREDGSVNFVQCRQSPVSCGEAWASVAQP